MYAPEIARQLRQRGHDVVAVKERPELVEASDAELFAWMAAEGRAIVTNNAADFMPLFAQAALDEQHHNGLWLTSDRSLPRRRDTIGRFVAVLDRLLQEHPDPATDLDQLRWLP